MDAEIYDEDEIDDGQEVLNSFEIEQSGNMVEEDDSKKGDEIESQECQAQFYFNNQDLEAESISDDDAGSLKDEDLDMVWAEKLDIIRKRKYVDEYEKKLKKCQRLIAATREEQNLCWRRLADLKEHHELISSEICCQKSNNVVVCRLKAEDNKICQELELEKEHDRAVTEKLKQAEYQLSRIDLNDRIKVEKIKKDLKRTEEKWKKVKELELKDRKIKEENYAKSALAQKHQMEKSKLVQLNETVQRENFIKFDATLSQQRHQKFLAQSLGRAKQAEFEAKSIEADRFNQKLASVLKLKTDTDMNKENLRAAVAKKKSAETEIKAENERWIHEAANCGRNATIAFARKQRTEQFEFEKQKFKENQRQKEIEIVEKLLIEKQALERRKRLMPELFTDPKHEKGKIVKQQRGRRLRVLDDLQKSQVGYYEPAESDPVRGIMSNDRMDADEGADVDAELDEQTMESAVETVEISADACDDTMNECKDICLNGIDLAKPEFDGLWDRNCKVFSAPAILKRPGCIKSKMEADILSRKLDCLRENIVVKQVVGRREFKGCPFSSKPRVIHFKDFDVGETYCKRVVLTNVSLSLNYCKVVGLAECLKDFVQIMFDPPGQMSAGMTCEMIVTFEPKINKDLFGEIQMMAQSGEFFIPIQCTTKKCCIVADACVHDFGTAVIGEMLYKHITLTNKGALPSAFTFTKVGVDTGNISNNNSNTKVQKKKDSKLKQNSEASFEEEEGSVGVEEEEEEKEPVATEVILSAPPSTIGFSSAQDCSESLDGLYIGQVRSGIVGPFSTVKLQIVWQPMIPGKVVSEFLVSFTDPSTSDIKLEVRANGTDVPVSIDKTMVDLKICTYDRLFQDCITIQNRANTALKLKFEVCKELRNHLELLPKNGFIQACSQFTAQLKFLPRKTLSEDAKHYFDEDTGVLEAPLTIRVADQTLPIVFTVHAVVTNSDFQFNTSCIDFGFCTIHEAVTYRVSLTNCSILPQQFGFIGVPDYADVQPNDGFGVLLPLETIDLDIIFRPQKAENYNFTLKCKSLINREFVIHCRGTGVHPPLRLSHQVVCFAATAISDSSTVSLDVMNDHTDCNEFAHPVPRIGKGPIAPIGPTSFEFKVPEGIPISVSPSVGTVSPGQKCKVRIRFSPTLTDTDIRREAVYLLKKSMERKAEEEHQAALRKQKEEAEKAASTPKGKQKIVKRLSEGSVSILDKPASVEPPSIDDIVYNSSEYLIGKSSLIRRFTCTFASHLIPCYVASNVVATTTDAPQISYSVFNTLFLEVNCPSVQPELIVISDGGLSTIDFENVSVGHSVVRTVTIQNISGRMIELHGSCLSTDGPFMILNALRCIPPDGLHNIQICFKPEKVEKFQQVFEIQASCSRLHLTLKGVGINPIVSLSIKDCLLDMGKLMVGDTRQEIFTIENTSELSIQFSIRLDSHLVHSQPRLQLVTDPSTCKNFVGTQNNRGQQVFDCTPCEGVINPGTTMEITAMFAPDRASDYFADRCRISLFGQEESYVFLLRGQAKNHNMYILGGDLASLGVDMLSVTPVKSAEEVPSIPILVTLYSCVQDNVFTTASKEIFIGCVKACSTASKNKDNNVKSDKKKDKSDKKEGKKGGGGGGGKQNVEWTFDSPQQIASLGFSIDPLKGTADPETEKPITVTWTPPSDHFANKSILTSINCVVRGDITQTYSFLLTGLVKD